MQPYRNVFDLSATRTERLQTLFDVHISMCVVISAHGQRLYEKGLAEVCASQKWTAMDLRYPKGE